MKKILLVLVVIICKACTAPAEDGFELCSGFTYPYYQPELKYEGNFYEVKQHFFSNYQTIVAENNSGIVRVQFKLNCKGQSGMFNAETYGLDFQRAEIDSAISNQLLSLTKQLDKWIPATDEDGEKVNSHKFYAFKIKEGKLIDILPK